MPHPRRSNSGAARMGGRMRRALAMAVLGLAAVAVGCAPLQERMHPGEAATLAEPWMKADVREAPPPLYCYRTLGHEDCYRTPPGTRSEEHTSELQSLMRTS